MKLYLYKSDDRWVLTEIAQTPNDVARGNFGRFSSFDLALMAIRVWLKNKKYGTRS